MPGRISLGAVGGKEYLRHLDWLLSIFFVLLRILITSISKKRERAHKKEWREPESGQCTNSVDEILELGIQSLSSGVEQMSDSMGEGPGY